MGKGSVILFHSRPLPLLLSSGRSCVSHTHVCSHDCIKRVLHTNMCFHKQEWFDNTLVACHTAVFVFTTIWFVNNRVVCLTISLCVFTTIQLFVFNNRVVCFNNLVVCFYNNPVGYLQQSGCFTR
jgi:hypothetical protein